MDRSKLSKYVSAFLEVNEKHRFKYSQSDICRFSGIDSGVLSRFLNGHNDMSSARFLGLIESMPEDFQREYWKVVGVLSLFWQEGNEVNWEEAINKIDKSDKKTLARIFSALANKHSTA